MREPGRRLPPRSPERADPRHRIGRQGEDAAARLYRSAGFAVVARNLRTTLGELDLVVRRGSLLAAVEVKTRRGGAPERTVGDEELARRARALAAVARVLAPDVRRLRLRVDVAAVVCRKDGTLEVLVLPGRELPCG